MKPRQLAGLLSNCYILFYFTRSHYPFAFDLLGEPFTCQRLFVTATIPQGVVADIILLKSYRLCINGSWEARRSMFSASAVLELC